MKLGLGLYKHHLTKQNYLFARQCGATHLVIHLVDYFNNGNKSGNSQPLDDGEGWADAGDPDNIWSVEDLLAIKKEIANAGLTLEAVENFDPAHWHDVLLDGPQRDRQMENCKAIVRNLGAAGIPVLGYNFSVAGVASRIEGRFARGEAMSVGMDEVSNEPIPNGMVWNMVYNPNAPQGFLPEISHEELWERYKCFLLELLPVAEEAGVQLALHPDDPPVPRLRRQPRLVYQPNMYDRALEISDSRSNCFEFCLGTLMEMTEGDIYAVLEQYARSRRIAYIHCRNVTGKAPCYRETFIDDGDLDMIRIMRILRECNYDGVVIPDHTPRMDCDAPWHAGMAHALGYLQGIVQSFESK